MGFLKGAEVQKLEADPEAVGRLDADIRAKGLEIRALKAEGAAKSQWGAEVQVLLQLKASYRELVPGQCLSCFVLSSGGRGLGA